MTHYSVFRYLLTVLCLAPLSTAFAECARDDIDHYLDRGFSPDQITQICGKAYPDPAAADKISPASLPAAEQASPAKPVSTQSSSAEDDTKNTTPPAATKANQDVSYLQTVLDAEQVTITDEHLIIVQDRCFEYGAEDAIGIQKSVCATMKTAIARQGLEVIRVTNPIPLLRDAELIVQSSIHRDTVFKQKLKTYDRKAFNLYYPSTPKTLNIGIKKGHKPTEVASAIERLISK